jgi:23S rRNA (cytidine1920-2'-O)/16S rRNA (cytidine1409-2'-O)-methyltransferase
MAEPECPYVSRAGLKLAAGLDSFALAVEGLTCADFGANVGGFVDCLLQRGAARVFAVDTGYGALAWALRKDPRVVVMERTNALRAEPPEPVDLVTIDVAWTPQRLILPAAGRWLKRGGRIVSLLKPHYEATAAGRGRAGKSHVLTPEQAQAQCDATCRALAGGGWTIRSIRPSPIVGAGGNVEFLLLVEPPGPGHP